MLLWFAGLSWLMVAALFQSPALDYRLVMLGAVLPLADALTGGDVLVLHTLLASAVLLVIVLIATRRRRLVRRRWIGLPLGLLAHLVLDGTWANTKVFWWPASGWSFGRDRLPELDRGAWLVVMELVGVAALAWAWSRYGLSDRAARARFVRTGHVPR
jgi:membrane-bound metal-dependent hydrolase YbcI (DUF457 family)